MIHIKTTTNLKKVVNKLKHEETLLLVAIEREDGKNISDMIFQKQHIGDLTPLSQLLKEGADKAILEQSR